MTKYLDMHTSSSYNLSPNRYTPLPKNAPLTSNAPLTTNAFKTNHESVHKDNSHDLKTNTILTNKKMNTYEPKSSATIWGGTVGTSSLATFKATFKATFEDYSNQSPFPEYILKATRLHIVGQVDIVKIDKFTKNRGNRKMYIYGLNILDNNKTFEQLSIQFINKQRVGVIEVKSGHIYIVPEVFKNKINILKNKNFISGPVVIVMIKDVAHKDVVHKEAQKNTSFSNLFNALNYYQYGILQHNAPPQYQQQYAQQQYAQQQCHQHTPPQYQQPPPQYQQRVQYQQPPPQYQQLPPQLHNYNPRQPQSYTAPTLNTNVHPSQTKQFR